MTLQDPKLPRLAGALDDATMTAVLSRGVSAALADKGITSVHHRILKHTIGKRCVIQYSLNSTEHPAGVVQVIGKLYRKNRGEKIFENMMTLWSVANAQNPPFKMPEPFSYLSEPGMVVQQFVAGRPLADLVGKKGFASGVKLVAQNMAQLHGLRLPGLEVKTMSDHIKKYCRPGPEVLMSVQPEIIPLMQDILAYILDDKRLQDQPLCPVHGDLGFKQILMNDDRAFFVDFDGLGQSHAALDVAHFLVALEVYLGHDVNDLAGLFLETYRQNGGTEVLATLNIYKAFAYLRRAMICFRAGSGSECRRRVRRLLERAHETNEKNRMEATKA